MWKCLLLCLIYLLSIFCFGLVDAAVYILPAQPKQSKFENTVGCYEPDFDVVLAYNQTFSPEDGNSCRQYTCYPDGSTEVYTCGAIEFPSSCTRVPGKKFLAYPKCCDGVSCPPQASTTTSTPNDQNTVSSSEESTSPAPEGLSNSESPDSEPIKNSTTKLK